MQIVRTKPNPAGKDTAGHRPIHRQLLGEWVDLVNNSGGPVHLGGLHLANEHYDAHCTFTKTQVYWSGRSDEVLPAGGIVRVHTGLRSEAYLMDAQDQLGVALHSYADSGLFVLNNRCGDRLSLWTKDAAGNWRQPAFDTCAYAPNPPEGAVLVRVGDRLVVQSTAYVR